MQRAQISSRGHISLISGEKTAKDDGGRFIVYLLCIYKHTYACIYIVKIYIFIYNIHYMNINIEMSIFYVCVCVFIYT